MPATILTHFFNEELLLGWWLRHHREIFDHGVLVDRGSTDRSRAIIRSLVPDWDVVASRNPLFDARDADLEMMDLERRLGGWKLILNVSELLLHDDLRRHLHDVERTSPATRCIGVPVITMVDAPHEHDRALDDRPLFEQRHHRVPAAPGAVPHMRFLHREPHGAYGPGRHAVSGPYAVDEELAVVKYQWSPYPQVRGRRLQIARAIPDADIRLGMSWGLFFTGEELDEQFAGLSRTAVDLHDDPRSAATLGRLRRGYPRHRPEPVVRVTPDPRRRVAIGGETPRIHQLAAALAATHDVRGFAGTAHDAAAPAGWAEIVIADARAAAEAHVRRAPSPLVVDLAGCEPADLDDELLLRGDFFLWEAGRADAWIARFASLGRLSDPRAGAGELGLLGAAVAPEDPAAVACERLEPFLREPRRTTARVAADTPLAVSRIAYFRRHEAALDAVLNTAGHLIEIARENERLRADYERLRAEHERLRGEYERLQDGRLAD